MKKKLLALFMVFAVALALVACDDPTPPAPEKFTVTFDTQGGTAVPSQEVEKGQLATRPANDPTKAGDAEGNWSFKNWFTTATGDVVFDFSKAIEANVTVYAQWTREVVVPTVTLSFNSKEGGSAVAPITVEVGGQVEEPAAPTREGFKFEGWFKTKRGLTWLEPERVQFPLTLEENMTLHAYWEPVNSKTHNWAPGETYVSSMSSSSTIILNPFTYQWSHESSFMDMMKTTLYGSEIDWDKAIEEGIAEAPGDFSKIVNKEFSIDALDYVNIKVGATRFPVDSHGDEHLTPEGRYDRDAASQFKDTSWTYHLRNDVVFEDGTPVTAHTYEFALKQYLDPTQNNFRANSYYKTADNKNGYAILNAYEYYTGTATWDQVGFEVIDDYTFKVTTWEDMSQSQAVSFGSMTLVHPETYTASLTSGGTNSTYGTPETPFVSYGAFVIKSWDANQKIVFNKNYDYVLKGTINFKSEVIEIVDDENQKFLLFDQGKLSVVGLTKDHYDQYAERPGVKKSWNGYPQNLMLNTAEPRTTGAGKIVHPSIMFDKEFRQAMFYGFNRQYYADSVYAPNTASMIPMPGNAKNYLLDALAFGETPQHLLVLEKHGINPATVGYIPEKAKQLFEAAYDRWLAEDNTGPVTLILISDDDPFGRDLVTYIKDSYETLFAKDGVKRLVIEVREMAAEQLKSETAAWNFDLTLNNVGFGLNTDAYYQYPAIGFNGIGIGGASLGMTQPYDMSNRKWQGYEPAEPPLAEDIVLTLTQEFADTAALLAHVNATPELAAKNYARSAIIAAPKAGSATDEMLYVLTNDNAEYWYHVVEINLINTFYYLEELGPDEREAQGYTWFYNQLVGTADKAEGLYRGEMGVFLQEVVFSSADPYSAPMKEPFAGAAQDLAEMIAVFEDVFLTYVPMVPTVARSGATLYAENVVIEWPEYSYVFGWGANRYRYLNTDPDFQ
jgi:oligopeptide transport system substrate-binding protein